MLCFAFHRNALPHTRNNKEEIRQGRCYFMEIRKKDKQIKDKSFSPSQKSHTKFTIKCDDSLNDKYLVDVVSRKITILRDKHDQQKNIQPTVSWVQLSKRLKQIDHTVNYQLLFRTVLYIHTSKVLILSGGNIDDRIIMITIDWYRVRVWHW